MKSLPSTNAVTGVFEALSFFRDSDFAIQRFDAFGDVFETTLIGQRLVFIRGDQAIQDLFSQSSALEGWWPRSVRLLLGSRSLANRNGESHKARRRVVGQLFAAAALRRYTPSIVASVDALAADLPCTDQPTSLAKRMRRFAFAVIATTVLGLDDAQCEALFIDFEIWTKALFSIPIAFPGSPFSQALAARHRLLERLRTVLHEADGSRGGLDLLTGALDEAGLPLTDMDLVEQLLLLLFAGYETTASSLSCLMRALLLHPEQMAWLQQELNGLNWPPDPSSNNPYDPSEAPQLQAVVSEVMRLTPPVGGFFRRTRQSVALAGVDVPADRVIQVALSATNRLGDSDLECFRPQRHLDGSLQATLIPFGGGERVCLGKALAELEIRLMTVGLLKQVQLELSDGQNLDLQLIPSPSPKDGLLVNAKA